MAANLIQLDSTKLPSSRILQALRAIREGRSILGQELAAVQSGYLQGDGSQDAHYTLWASICGISANDYASPAAAGHAGYNELMSLYAKITAPSGVGDSTGAALDQACGKFGV